MFSYITRTQLRKPKTPQVMRHHDPAYTLYSDFIHCLAFSAKEKLCFLMRGPIPSHTFHLAVVPGPFAGEWLSSPSWPRQFSKARPVVLETVLPWGLSGASRAESGDTVLAGSHRCEAGSSRHIALRERMTVVCPVTSVLTLISCWRSCLPDCTITVLPFVISNYPAGTYMESV